MAELDPEDVKMITLARSVRTRIAAAEGAAVRDVDGRTYIGCTVALPSLRLSALQTAIAAAVASGTKEIEAAVLVTEAAEVDPASVAAVRDLGIRAPIFRADATGSVLAIS